MSIKLPNLGSGRTTCKVLVHRHNRENPQGAHKGNKDSEIDISSYVNRVAIATNIAGGGSGSIGLIAAFPWEDEIAANDLINIYINTNRGDESSVYPPEDNTWKYNKGNVRLFFGYVDSLTKSVSVGGAGTRITTYTMELSSFDKAIRATTIYSNPHLSYQGDGTPDTIRPDIANNLGGTILIQKGFPIAGSPRQLIVAHLFRTLGFGGQWVLPAKYEDDLGKYDDVPSSGGGWATAVGSGLPLFANVDTMKSDFTPWRLKWKTEKRSKEDVEKFGRPPYFFKPSISQYDQGDPVIYNTSFRYYPKTIEKFGKQSAGLMDFQNAISLVGDYHKVVDVRNHQSLRHVLHQVLQEPSDVSGLAPGDFWGAYVNNLNKILLNQGGGVYYIAPEYSDNANVQNLLLTAGTIRRNKKGKIVFEADYTKSIWKNYFSQNTPKVNPDINHTTLPDGPVHPAKTLFNVLCLDYMEDVDGNYVMSEMYEFDGPLYSQLDKQANSTIAELFFDLRVVPDFTVRGKDGRGMEMQGALPVVPAVIHRERPFTNYSTVKPVLKPSTDFENKTKIEIGSLASDDPTLTSFQEDQYFLKRSGSRGVLPIIGTEASWSEVKSTLSAAGIGVTLLRPQTEAADKKQNRRRRRKSRKGKNVPISKKILSFPTTGESSQNVLEEVWKFQVQIGEEVFTLAQRPYDIIFSLPRPVFRSPDDHRITEELKVSSMNAILGFIKKGGKGANNEFIAFGITNPGSNANAIKNNTKEKTWTPGAAKSKGTKKKKWSIEDAQRAGYVLGSPFSGKSPIQTGIDPTERQTTWHILDYMTIRNEDVMAESYARGDFQITNVRELFMSVLPGFEVQRATSADILPIITPSSVYRNGIRVRTDETAFGQFLISGGTNDSSWTQTLGLRWAIMLDMWEQHDHEYLSGSISLRGMPGIRVGYRVDRKELGLSFYVESVSHSWEYPGVLSTQVSVSRGQPIVEDRVLEYYEPEPFTTSNRQKRIELGRIFRSSKINDGQQLGSGSLVNLPTTMSSLERKNKK